MSEKPKYPGFCEVCVNSLKDYFFCKNSCNFCESEDVPTEFMHEEPPDQFDWAIDYEVTGSDWTTGDDWL